MALKDWKKISNGKNIRWKSKKAQEILELRFVPFYGGGEWAINTLELDGTSTGLIYMGKTKSQALAFARQYMRTH